MPHACALTANLKMMFCATFISSGNLLQLDDTAVYTAAGTEVYISSLSSLSQTIAHLVSQVADQQGQYQGKYECGKDQQKPVKVTGHGHRSTQPAIPAPRALFLHTSTNCIPHTSLRTASIGTDLATVGQFRARHGAVHKLSHSWTQQLTKDQ